MEAGILVAGMTAIGLLALALIPLAVSGQWLVAAGIGVPCVAAIFVLQWLALRQKWDRDRR